MKKFASLLAIVVILAMSNCSEIPENNDPILGIWINSEIVSQTNGDDSELLEEWIFNDAFLGRYHSYTDGNLEFFTDFSWDVESGTYTIEYVGTDIPTIEVTLEQAANLEILALEDGNTFAERE